MNVQAKPKTHPGGVQGALFNALYQSDVTPDEVDNPPIARAAKFKIRNIMVFDIILDLIFDCKCKKNNYPESRSN